MIIAIWLIHVNITFHCYSFISSLGYNLLTVVLLQYIRTSDVIQPSSLKVYALCLMYSHFPHPRQSLFQLSTSESDSLDATFEWNDSELTVLYLVHFTLYNVFQIHPHHHRLQISIFYSYTTLHCSQVLINTPRLPCLVMCNTHLLYINLASGLFWMVIERVYEERGYFVTKTSYFLWL